MLPNKGKVLPQKNVIHTSEVDYAEAIANALRHELGQHAVKTLRRWTGASERCVKNWLIGENGPSGKHLILLMRRSNAVLTACLSLAERPEAVVAANMAQLEEFLKEALDRVQSVMKQQI